MTAITSLPRRFGALDIASRAALLSFSSNALLMVAKLTVGVMFGSVAVLGDGIDSAEDVFASAVAFFAVRLALQPADEAHPYGHGKTESLAALSQAALIAGGAALITVTAVRRLFDVGREIDVGPSLTMMMITVVVNLAVAAYAFRAARVSGSVAIASDARHLLTNVAQGIGVAAALVLVGVTGEHIFDPIVALIIAAYLAWTAVRITQDALGELIDTALPPEEMALLEDVFSRREHGIRGYHALRTRKSGREKHIDVHVLLDPSMSVSEAHRVIEKIERHVEASIPGAVLAVHADPDEPDIMDRDGASGAATPVERGLHLHHH